MSYEARHVAEQLAAVEEIIKRLDAIFPELNDLTYTASRVRRSDFPILNRVASIRGITARTLQDCRRIAEALNSYEPSA